MAKRVLFVDDNRALAEAYCLALNSPECKAFAASSGAEALKFLAGEAPVDLVLVDLRMPDIKGPELLEEIHRRFPSMRKSQTVILSSMASNSQELTALAEKGIRSVEKPDSLAQVNKLIQRLLESSD